MAYNRLINETSVYLRNHSHQKINWYPWCEEAFEIAKKENKLIFISIGFSACHWCHELSRNCFDNDAIAQTLNRYYINVKVDKEERPDVDLFYMNAIEIITNSSGWPISCFLLPDGSPVYGGTYFPPEQFLEMILGLQHTFINDREKLEEIGEELMIILKNTNIIEKKPIEQLSVEDIKLVIEPWRRKFDNDNGGTSGSPKFPLPVSLMFMLNAGYYLDDPLLTSYVDKTLTNIAKGGIYDQLRGGFFRYTDDLAWKKPHFEKMLYDNALLVAAYSFAYRNNPNPLYEKVIKETVNFMKLNLSRNNLYLSSVDAEVGDIEGKYYKWKTSEFKEILGDDYDLMADYFGLKENKKQNVLFINMDEETLAEKYGLSLEECKSKIEKLKEILLNIREQRDIPSIDSKIISGWNALFLSGLCEAYRSFGENYLLKQAIDIADALSKNYIQENYRMFRVYENQTPAFLDDYAFTITAFLRLYRITGDNAYLKTGKGLVDYIFKHFYDEKTGMFFFTDNSLPSIIPRMMDFVDKAYPSSNSVIAKALLYLSFMENNQYYRNIVIQMINNIKDQMPGAGPYVAHWVNILFYESYQPTVVFIPKEHLSETCSFFVPNLFVFPDVGDANVQNSPPNILDETGNDYSKIVDFARKNKNSKWKVLITIIFILITWQVGMGQKLCTISVNESDLAFNNNENLVYAASYSWGPIFADVGEVSLKVNKTKVYPIEFHMIAEAKTYKFYDNFFKVRDFYEAKFTIPDIRSLYFHRNINEGNYSIKNTYNFDWENNKIKAVIEKRGTPRELEMNLEDCTLDVITYFYYLRNLDFNDIYFNKVYTLSIVLDDGIYNIKCRFLGKEQKKIKALKAKVNCLKFAVEVIAGSVFKGDEKIILWISDDKNHVPLELESPIIVGTVRGRLMRHENLKYPLNIVK
jgi:uncharacterized protein YyaL (SSP411 family)